MIRVYRALLLLYPASFRLEYGAEMAAIVERRLRDASGPASRALVLAGAIAGLVRSAALVQADQTGQDLRYVARTLRRAPGFGFTAVLIVALGIGATTAAFSVTDFVLIRPLPFRDPSRLVNIWEKTPGYPELEMSAPNYRDWTSAAKSFESTGVSHGTAATFIGPGEPRRFVGSAVSADLFPTLGVGPVLGRSFTKEDDRAGTAGTMILSDRLWRTEFGADPTIIGRTITTQIDFDQSQYTVIGVMGPAFHYPTTQTLFWITTRFADADYAPAERTNNWLYAVGRLRDGVTIDQARAELAVLAAQSERQFPKENEDTGAALYWLREEVSDRLRVLLIVLSAAAACVLLVACANLANLLLARALERRRELAVRSAIGAGRERIARQLLTESLVLALAGGAVGVGLAYAGVPLLSLLVPPWLPLASAPTVDLRVLAYAMAATVLTGLAFGAIPIARLGQADVSGLRDGARAGGGARDRLRSALVLGEVVVCVVLLVSAGLLTRALLRIQATDPGFDPGGVLTLRANLPMPQYRTIVAREAFYARVGDEVRALPGVRAAGFTSFLPMGEFRGGIWPVVVPGEPEGSGEVRRADSVAVIRYVTPGFFAAMGIPLRRGRDISAGDDRGRPYVAVVSESFVRRYWPGQDPMSRHFTFAFADREVVGVVGDVRFRGLERTSEPQVYLSSRQVDDGAISFYAPRSLAIRTAVPPAQIAAAVRDIIRRADPKIAITEMQTMEDLLDRDTASRTVQVRVVTAFAVVAFVLAAVGIHGLLSFAVSQRTQEIGVRVALGAQPRDIFTMVVGGAMRLGAAGLALGAAAGYAAGRSMEAVLAGVRPADAATFASAIALVGIMMIVGTLVPTMRALRVDPIRAIRVE
jgi:predicted permease